MVWLTPRPGMIVTLGRAGFSCCLGIDAMTSKGAATHPVRERLRIGAHHLQVNSNRVTLSTWNVCGKRSIGCTRATR